MLEQRWDKERETLFDSSFVIRDVLVDTPSMHLTLIHWS